MDRRIVPVAIALVLLAGCAGLGVGGDESDGIPTVDDGSGTIAESPTVADGRTATVTDVIDGDTIDVRYPNGTTDRVRLLGIDTPEVHTENDPAEFEGVPDTEAGRDCLREAGRNATAFAESLLDGTEVALALDPSEGPRDRYDRLLAYVAVDGTDVNYRLIETGHARVYDTQFARADGYYEAEQAAKAENRGVWRCRTEGTATDRSDRTPLVVADIHADAAGNDHENPNDEYVVFRNDGGEPLEMGGWTVSDDGGHSYVVPDGFALAPGETVTLRSGSGEDTDSVLYWGADGAIWNNAGDTIRVSDADGRLVLERSYG